MLGQTQGTFGIYPAPAEVMPPVHVHKPSADACTGCCTHAVEKLVSQFSKPHSWAKYYVTIRQFPSQQALQRVTNPKESSHVSFHCATGGSLFENVMLCLIFSYLADAQMSGVVLRSLLL